MKNEIRPESPFSEALKSIALLVAGVGFLMILPGASCGNPKPCSGEKPCPDAICLPTGDWFCPPTPGEPSVYDCKNPPALKGLARSKSAIPGSYVVVLNRNPVRTALEATAIEARVTNLASKYGLTVTQVYKTSFSGFSAKISASKIPALAKDPTISYIQEVGRKSIQLSWGLDRSDQRDLPLDNTFDPGATGRGVDIFMVDTGCPASNDLKTCAQNHPDFLTRLVPEAFTAITFGGVMDQHGHGTHVMGTAGGTVWGVAKEATLHGVRVLDQNGSGDDTGVISGIDYVTNWTKAHPGSRPVISMSLGGSPAPALDAAVCTAIDAGVTVVVAGGNSSEDSRNSSPARVLQAITVGAADRNDEFAWFSNGGPFTDIIAPGVDIESDTPNGGTQTMSGTSMATPHVAGSAALVIQRHPGTTPADVAKFLIDSATKDKIKNVFTGTPNLNLFNKE